jgi:bifunctional non-homologous end joining protein LigD
MAELEHYPAKRNFKQTAEPAGGKPDPGKLRFVVQKHDASHLHYDFRLEVKGVLKSWAVPRGPSMDPEERRLAMAVEDHPYDYKDFEGIIPKGQYGGGTVIVWDEGTYEPASDEKLKDKAAKEHWMMSNYYKNALKISLHGQKLNGDFILIKFKDDKYEGGWRLIKADDEYSHSRFDGFIDGLSKQCLKMFCQVVPGTAIFIFDNSRRRAFSDNLSAILSGSRPDIDYPVAFCDHIHVMFD